MQSRNQSDAFQRKGILVQTIHFKKIEQELISVLLRSGRMVFVHENGVFPSQTPVLFTPMQFQNKQRCIHLLRWNNNLILVNIQREFMDQLLETYEIGMDSQLMSQVCWRKKLIQTFGQDERFKDIKYTLEDIILDNEEPTSSFKVKKIRKEEQKKDAFMDNQNIEVERPQIRQKKGQTNIVKSPLFKQNLLGQEQNVGIQKEVGRKLDFQQFQNSQIEIQSLRQDLQKIQKDQELKDLVNDISFEQKEEQIKHLQLQLEQKQSEIAQLEVQKEQQGNLIHTQLSKEDKQIIVYRNYSYLKEFLKNKKVEVRPYDVQFWRIKISNSPGSVFQEKTKSFGDIQMERFKLFIEKSDQYWVGIGMSKEDIFRQANEFDQTNDQAIKIRDQIVQGILIKEVPFVGTPPWWSQMKESQIAIPNWLGICNLFFFNSLPYGEKLVKAFKSSLIQNLITVFYVNQRTMETNDLFIEFTYSKGINIIAIINNQPRFEYARYAEGGFEGYQILNKDFRQESPQFEDFLYDGFSLCKFCDKCGYFSSEPSVNLQDDVIHYQFKYTCSTFSVAREDQQ